MLGEYEHFLLAEVLTHVLLTLLFSESRVYISAVEGGVHEKVSWAGRDDAILNVQEKGKDEDKPLVKPSVSNTVHERKIGAVLLRVILWLRLRRN